MACVAMLMATLVAPAQFFEEVAFYPVDDRTNAKQDSTLSTTTTDSLVARLASDGKYTVVDRQSLQPRLRHMWN